MEIMNHINFMKKSFGLVAGIVLLLAQAAVAQAPPGENRDYLSGRVLVKFKDSITDDMARGEVSRHNAKIQGKIAGLNTLVLNVPQKQENKIIEGLSHSPNVEYAEPDHVASAALIPSDPYFAPNQWGLENTGQIIESVAGVPDADIDASTAWDRTTGNGIKVAILDSGIDQNHEDLSAKVSLRRNFTTSSTDDDIYGHGTHVAGIVAAITGNNIGVAGSCPDCTLLSGKVLGDNGTGAYSWISSGITWAADNGAKVINLSLGGSSPSKTLERAVNYAWNKGTVVVAAAGNSGNRSKLYPAAYTKAIAVAATNNQDQKASFSSYGAKWVDVSAPGENVFSTFPNHPFVIQTKYGRSQNYDFASGTSMAAPMVAGAAALVWSTNYGSTASMVRTRLETTAEHITGTGIYWSSGRINAASAVAP